MCLKGLILGFDADFERNGVECCREKVFGENLSLVVIDQNIELILSVPPRSESSRLHHQINSPKDRLISDSNYERYSPIHITRSLFCFFIVDLNRACLMRI